MNEWLHLELDDAWSGAEPGCAVFSAIDWGPRLRYAAPPADVRAFASGLPELPPFVLLGSGDFHHLTRLLVERTAARVVVSFDNHPDWDVRPPDWSCGGWVARTARDRRVSVWGCGNVELRLPWRFFAPAAAVREGRLEVYPWQERQPGSVCRRFECITREGWRTRFERFASGLRETSVYVTVDLDCLRAEDAVTNWESGLFTADDVSWAVRALREEAVVVGGDVCGAWSTPVYARRRQAFAAAWDHPRMVPPPAEARSRNGTAFARIAAAFS